MARKEETVVTLEALTCVAGIHKETLGVRALLSGTDGRAQLLLVQGIMPSQQTSREESHSGWLEYNGAARKFDRSSHRLLPITATNAGRLQPADTRQPAAGLSVSTRSGQYIATCAGDKVAVTRWEWYWKAEGGEATEAVQRGWRGKGPTPPVPKFGDRPAVIAQLWLSEDARTVAVLAIDQDDNTNRELYLLGRGAVTEAWPAHWKAKPEVDSPHRSKGLNLSAQELFLGRVLVQCFDTPRAGRCCHLAHVWRRVEEGDQYRGFPPQLVVQVRAICVKLDVAVFKSETAQLQLQAEDSWLALEQAFNVGAEDVMSPPVVARMDPTGSVLAVVANHAEGTPLLFVGMPGFELARNVGAHSKGVEQRVTTLHLDDYAAAQPQHSVSENRAPNRCDPAQDIAWTANGCLVGIISTAGSLLVLPKLGLPLPLKPVAASDDAMAAASAIPRLPSESATGAAAMPALQKRLSMPICPISLVFPKFALLSTGGAGAGDFASSVPDSAPGSALAASQAGGSQAGESASAGSKASRRSSAGSRSNAAPPEPVKKRIFTLCGHADSSTQFAACDGSVTVVVEVKNFETHSLVKHTKREAPFSSKELVELLISPRPEPAPAMIHWPAGYLPSYATGARLALGLGFSLDVSGFEGCLTIKNGTLRVRTVNGDWAHKEVNLRGSHLSIRAAAPPNTKPEAWKPAVKLDANLCLGAGWIRVNGRVLELSDGTREVEMQGGSNAEVSQWEAAIRKSMSGLGAQNAAALLRCVRKILQVLPWANERSATIDVLKAVKQAFGELLNAKQLYLAMHLLATAEHYVSHTAHCGLVLTKQWEQLRKEAAACAKAWAKTTPPFGLEDMFFGSAAAGPDRVEWSELEAVASLRACGSAATVHAQIRTHTTRLQRLNTVASDPITTSLDKTNTKADIKGDDGHKHDLELLAVGHRLYFDRRWPDALEYFKASGKVGRCALFATHIMLAADGHGHANLDAALKMALADIQDDAATVLNWHEGSPAVKPKSDYAIVYTMARLMHAVLMKQDFSMWTPVVDIARGEAPKAYAGGDKSWPGKWFDGLRKRKLNKAKLHASAAAIFKADGIQFLHQTVRLCYCARLPNAQLPTANFVRDLLCCEALNFGLAISFKLAVGTVLRAHPAGTNAAAKVIVDKELADIMKIHFSCALRRCEISRADKLIIASEQLFKADFCKAQRLQATMLFLRVVKQSLIKLVVPVPAAFHLPARLRRYEAKIVDPGSPSSSEAFEANLRANSELLIRQGWFLLRPAVAFLQLGMGKRGWATSSGIAPGAEDGDVTDITHIQLWGDFMLPYRLLLRYMWYQELRDTFSLSHRAVNRLHAKYVNAARLSQGESLSYRFDEPVDDQELLADRIALACTAVRLLAFDDVVHISKLHEMVITCIEDIERDLALYRPSEVVQLSPLKEALALYLPELGGRGIQPRHQVLRKKMKVRCPILDQMLDTIDDSAAGMVAEYEQWNQGIRQQTEVEKAYGMWNYELDREFQVFVAQSPTVRKLQAEPSSPFQSSGSPAAGGNELSAQKLTTERKVLREKHVKDFKEDLSATAGTPGVPKLKVPEQVGINDADGFDVSREKQATFTKTYTERAQREVAEQKLSFPIITVVDGVPLGQDGKPLSNDDLQTKIPAPAPAAKQAKGPADNSGSFKILSLNPNRRSANLPSKPSFSDASSTVNVLRHDGPHARARRRAGAPLTRLQMERPMAPPVTVGAALPDQEFDIDPYTGAIQPTRRDS